MARNPIESKGWKPEETESSVLEEIGVTSAIERVARRINMGTDTKNVPRAGEVDIDVVAKGAAYGEDVHEYDEVTLVAKKLGKMVRLAEEDLDDSPLAIIETKKREWANSYARYLDNACLAVTAPVGPGVPFESVYQALSVANAATGYTAGANIVKAPDVTHAVLSEALGRREESPFYDPSKEVLIASIAFRRVFREMRDTDGRLEFAPSPAVGQPETLFGVPIVWTQAGRTSATANARPTGNPLLVMGNRDFLLLGVRSGPESVVIDGRDGASAVTDETLLKMRSRRAFKVGHEDAFVIVEKTPAA